MASERSFNGVADSLLGAFLGRNNDINGYWAIGILCSYAHRSGSALIELDLKIPSNSSAPCVEPLAARYQMMLYLSTIKHRLPIELVRESRTPA